MTGVEYQAKQSGEPLTCSLTHVWSTLTDNDTAIKLDACMDNAEAVSKEKLGVEAVDRADNQTEWCLDILINRYDWKGLCKDGLSDAVIADVQKCEDNAYINDVVKPCLNAVEKPKSPLLCYKSDFKRPEIADCIIASQSMPDEVEKTEVC